MLSPDHPRYYYVMMGGKSWTPPNARHATRIYFDAHVRGGDWWQQEEKWKTFGPAQFPGLTPNQRSTFPTGYYDIEAARFVRSRATEWHWEADQYDEFMRRSIERRTFAPILPPEEVLTRDGFIMEPGLEVMFVGGQIHQRPQWDVSGMLGRGMIVWHRYGDWFVRGRQGNYKTFHYGSEIVGVLEWASHTAPYCYCLVPADGRPFRIDGRNFNTEHSAVYVDDPSVSLMTIDGRRIVTVLPRPTHQIPMPA